MRSVTSQVDRRYGAVGTGAEGAPWCGIGGRWDPTHFAPERGFGLLWLLSCTLLGAVIFQTEEFAEDADQSIHTVAGSRDRFKVLLKKEE